MKNNFTIIAFYTDSYKEIIENNLLDSLKQFPELKYKIYKIESKGKWIKNVNLKPRVILQALEELNTDIVILDADSKIFQIPELLYNIDCDIACHFLDWNTQYQNKTNIVELLTGTLYIKNTEENKNLIKDWINKVEQNNIWEQKVLQKLLETKYKHLKIYNLPLEYCYIDTLPNGNKPFVKCNNPVIVQYQVSRNLKHKTL